MIKPNTLIEVECLDAIREGRLFDFIYDKGHMMTNSQLCSLVIELAYKIDKEPEHDVADELENTQGWGDD